jgi:DNA-binding transcriptional MerR regulator
MLRIGQLAELSGVSVRALRYYEEQGLLEADRTPTGQRAYPESAVEKVRFFQQMYAAGLTSRNIAALLPCMDTGHTDAEQRRMLQQQRDFIQGKLHELTIALSRLNDILAVVSTHP